VAGRRLCAVSIVAGSSFYHGTGVVEGVRIVQYKMILKRKSFPKQNDPEMFGSATMPGGCGFGWRI